MEGAFQKQPGGAVALLGGAPGCAGDGGGSAGGGTPVAYGPSMVSAPAVALPTRTRAYLVEVEAEVLKVEGVAPEIREGVVAPHPPMRLLAPSERLRVRHSLLLSSTAEAERECPSHHAAAAAEQAVAAGGGDGVDEGGGSADGQLVMLRPGPTHPTSLGGSGHHPYEGLQLRQLAQLSGQ